MISATIREKLSTEEGLKEAYRHHQNSNVSVVYIGESADLNSLSGCSQAEPVAPAIILCPEEIKKISTIASLLKFRGERPLGGNDRSKICHAIIDYWFLTANAQT